MMLSPLDRRERAVRAHQLADQAVMIGTVFLYLCAVYFCICEQCIYMRAHPPADHGAMIGGGRQNSLDSNASNCETPLHPIYIC